MSTSKRGASFSSEEDILLVECYVEFSQNPIIGINQTNDTLWSRVTQSYNRQLNPLAEPRTVKALQCRWSTLSKAAQKFSGCINQVEQRHPSGASEKDIVSMQQPLDFNSHFSFSKRDSLFYSWMKQNNCTSYLGQLGGLIMSGQI